MTYNAIAQAALQHSIALRVHTSVGGSFPEALTAVRDQPDDEPGSGLT